MMSGPRSAKCELIRAIRFHESARRANAATAWSLADVAVAGATVAGATVADATLADAAFAPATGSTETIETGAAASARERCSQACRAASCDGDKA